MCVTLNEGYLRAANRGSKNFTDFYSKYNISAFNEKTTFLVCLLLFFWDCRSTKQSAAIFSKPASYVFFCASVESYLLSELN